MEWTLKNIVVLVIITLVAIVLIISLFGPKIGLLNVVAKLGFKMSEWFLPTKAAEKLKPTTEEEIPSELLNSYYSLVDALEFGSISDKTNCLIKFNAFPNDFKRNIIDIHLIEDRDPKEYKLAIKKQGVLSNRKTIEGIIPCITRKENIGKYSDYQGLEIEKRGDFKKVKILGEDFNLLYQYDNQHICFLENCDNDCLHQMLIDEKIKFCDENYKNIFKDVFYQKTYYGNIKDWELIKKGFGEGTKWKYFGKDKRIPFEYTKDSTGLTITEYNLVFDLEKMNDENHKSNDDPGVWYIRKYYDTEDKWCFKDRKWWEIWKGKNWIYLGDDLRVPKDISVSEKVYVFGGLKEDKTKECE